MHPHGRISTFQKKLGPFYGEFEESTGHTPPCYIYTKVAKALGVSVFV